MWGITSPTVPNSKFQAPVPSSGKSPHASSLRRRREERREKRREGRCGRQVAPAHRCCLSARPGRALPWIKEIQIIQWYKYVHQHSWDPLLFELHRKKAASGQAVALNTAAGLCLPPASPGSAERQWQRRKRWRRNRFLYLRERPTPFVTHTNFHVYRGHSQESHTILHGFSSQILILHRTFCTAGHFEVTHWRDSLIYKSGITVLFDRGRKLRHDLQADVNKPAQDFWSEFCFSHTSFPQHHQWHHIVSDRSAASVSSQRGAEMSQWHWATAEARKGHKSWSKNPEIAALTIGTIPVKTSTWSSCLTLFSCTQVRKVCSSQIKLNQNRNQNLSNLLLLRCSARKGDCAVTPGYSSQTVMK